MTRKNLMRYLKKINGRWFYNRRVPEYARAIDHRFPRVVTALRTADDEQAIVRRNRLEEADDKLWASILRLVEAETDREKYLAGFDVREVHALPRQPPTRDTFDPDAVRRAAKVLREATESNLKRYAKDKLAEEPKEEGAAAARLTEALFGLVEKPKATVTEAMQFYVETMARPELAQKSPAQIKTWTMPKLLAAREFARICGDKPLVEIDVEDANAFFDHLEGRQLDGDDKFGFHAAKRQLGDMKLLHDAWCRRYRVRIDNPFAGLKVKRRGKLTLDNERRPFSRAWVEGKILSNRALLGMKDFRRRALLVIMETGARPGEIINLTASQIHLEAPIPYIEITLIDDDDTGLKREVKTRPSIRKLPLVGVALAAMKHHPEGFPKLFDKGNSFSAAVNKFLRTNGMMESDNHTVYSFRHCAEDRMKAGGLADDMRRQILGHRVDRERYGDGYSVKALRDALAPIALKFDPGIV